MVKILVVSSVLCALVANSPSEYASCTMCRCIFVLLFSPEDSRTADQIVLEELLPWLHMVHTQSPGAHIFLACSHAESPPSRLSDPSSWREHVERLANDVEQQVSARESYAGSQSQYFSRCSV